ncbi:hypothetical protein HII36_05580 [Nonomuraea sp. NN258]|uniref:hypothetical protein n=1 Tax=Nonomuraea antri TaxID=2730852 RepID=UPI0015692AD1|nr:hypothetical protein [Nonomuraea antri]NRQ31309.1 hypothetical protein [Nonomuraea antri]
MGSTLQRGAGKICREAAHALAAYLPPGTEVTYSGSNEGYQGRVYTVVGLDDQRPWNGYILRAHGGRPFFATLPSVHPSSRETRQRQQFDAIKRAVEQCCAVLAQQRVTVDVRAERTETGTVLVTWSSAEFIGAEQRAEKESATQAGQYIAAALYLLQALRAHTMRKEWHEVARDVESAAKLASRATVRV